MYEPEAIRRLIARYCDAVLRFDREAFAATWAAAAVWHIPGGEDLRGREAITERYCELRGLYPMCVQEILGSLILPESARTTVRELQWKPEGEGSQLIGVYDDTFSGPADAPLFASRRFTLLYRGPADLSGRLHGPERLDPP